MKKISFGSFPLTEIRKEDRRCLDRYMIKTFSDNISISDAVRNLAVTKQLMYITPDALMQSWLANGSQTDITSRADRSSNNIYDQVLKRAFYILKEFYAKISNAPFYKEYIYYPIYVEKIEKTTPMGSSDNTNQYTDVLMNYSFIIVSNDLTKNLKIDEIRYDENASLNFLYLFIEFFSGTGFEYSLHDFNKNDLEFLVKMYQFIEKSGKEPISAVLDLYKLLGLIKRVSEGDKNNSNLRRDLDVFLKGSDIHELTKYRGLINHEFMQMLSGKKTVSQDGGNGDYRKRFRELLELIFNSEKLSGLYSGVTTGKSRGERTAFLYQASKYREILNVAGELVDYNALNCKEVISQDHMDFDFKVESGETSIETSRQIVAQKYQSFFKDYVSSIRDYMEGLVSELIGTLGVDVAFNTNVATEQKTVDDDLKDALSDLSTAETTLARHQAVVMRAETRLVGYISNQSAHIRGGGAGTPFDTDIQRATNEKVVANRNASLESNNIEKIKANLIALRARKIILDNFNTNTTNSLVNDISKDTYKKLSDKIMSTLANDLTFIYDDGKRFFTNEKVAEGFINLTQDSTLPDPSTPSGFTKAVEAARNGTKPFIKQKDETEIYDITPEYMAGEILIGLDNDFNVTASDAVRAMDDSIRPILANILTEYQRNRLNTEIKKGTPPQVAAQADAYKEFMLENFQKNLSLGTKDGVMQGTLNNMLTDKLEMVLRNRFVTRVLANFKRMLRKTTVNKALAFDQHISQLHPLVYKLMKGSGTTPNNACNYFKSFIIDYDMVEQLARLKFITETQKFLDGIIHKPPRKLSDPLNRIKTVLEEYLGLRYNPVWIISNTNVYLSMPDTLSLTGTNLLSKIPKSELMQVCNIKPSDYWNESKMGKVAEFGNRKIKEIIDKITRIREKIEEKETEKENGKADKSRIKSINNEITRLNKNIDRLEDDLQKIKDDDREKKGQFTPNAFLFGDSAGEEPLLTQKEKDELISNKNALKDKLVNLNQYDDAELEELQKQQEVLDAKKKQNQPWDFDADNPDSKIPHTYDRDDTKYQEQLKREDERINDRDERFNKRNDRY